MKQTIIDHTVQAASSPKIGTIIASATTGTGVAHMLDLVNSGLSILAVVAGITLTSILIVKHLYEFKAMRQRHHECMRLKEDND